MKTQYIQEDLQRILEREFMASSYLDRFKLDPKGELPKISAVIPTYNRCPHTVEEESNPLGWCLESLLAQRSGGLAEIVVIDDASTDHTEEVVKNFSERSPIQIVYLRNPENKGSSISRNLAVEASKSNYVMFVDDDCVFSKYFLFGANFTLNKLEEDVAALHLPVYHRRTVPDLVRIKDIGVLDLEEGVITGNHNGFPIEFAEDLEGNFLDEKLKIIRPFEIKNLGGVFLARKKAFQSVGGFPEDFTWRNGYREETEVALKLQEEGYRIFLTPDPKFFCVHLKYGAQGDIHKREQELEPRLRYFVYESNVSRINTGNRVDPEEWFFSKIVGTYVTLGQRSPEAASRYLNDTHESFVLGNEESVTGVGGRIEDPLKREQIFERAIKEGDRVLRRASG